MSVLNQLPFDALSTTSAKEKSRYLSGESASAASSPALQYRSPWPWVLALAISITVWGGIGWLIWSFI